MSYCWCQRTSPQTKFAARKTTIEKTSRRLDNFPWVNGAKTQARKKKGTQLDEGKTASEEKDTGIGRSEEERRPLPRDWLSGTGEMISTWPGALH